jgi:hypothetical protein
VIPYSSHQYSRPRSPLPRRLLKGRGAFHSIMGIGEIARLAGAFRS